MAAVLKTAKSSQLFVGSNPTPSALISTSVQVRPGAAPSIGCRCPRRARCEETERSSSPEAHSRVKDRRQDRRDRRTGRRVGAQGLHRLTLVHGERGDLGRRRDLFVRAGLADHRAAVGVPDQAVGPCSHRGAAGGGPVRGRRAGRRHRRRAPRAGHRAVVGCRPLPRRRAHRAPPRGHRDRRRLHLTTRRAVPRNRLPGVPETGLSSPWARCGPGSHVAGGSPPGSDLDTRASTP